MKRYAITIRGKVQGVFFRDFTRQTAIQLGLTGFVRNEPDGSVYVEAEGDEPNLHQFVAWCHKGPQSATVTSVTHEEKPLVKEENATFVVW